MSSITGPSLGSELPRTILPMEVIMVSRYTSPVVSSFTTQLELMLERPGFDTILMDIVPTGVSRSTSMKSVHADAFSWDSDSVKEARAHYFTTHSWYWTHSNMADFV